MPFYFHGIAVALLGLIIFVICKHYCIDGMNQIDGENAAQTYIDSDECQEHRPNDLSQDGQFNTLQWDLPPSYSNELPPSYDECCVVMMEC